MKYVKVFPKEICLQIAKVIYGEGNGVEDELLFCLPDEVFDRVFRVDFTDGEVIVYDDFESSSKIRWHIPPYFCKWASLLNMEEKTDD